jgi:peptidylprolyl isomerase
VERAGPGDRIKVHFTGRLDDGTVFATSANQTPLELTLGTGAVIPGLERALFGLWPGAFVIENIPARQAFGAYDRTRVLTVERTRITLHGEVEVGKRLVVEIEPGQQIQAKIVAIGNTTVTLDLNHPLAGKDLTLEIRVLEVSKNSVI